MWMVNLSCLWLNYTFFLSVTILNNNFSFLDNYLCILLGYGTLDEWEFGLHRIMYYPKNKSQTERLFIFRSLASCPKNETKFVR